MSVDSASSIQKIDAHDSIVARRQDALDFFDSIGHWLPFFGDARRTAASSRAPTIGAMGCQVAIADKIVEHKGDYLLALKGNQPTLEAEVADYFNSAPAEELVVKDAKLKRGSAVYRDANLHRFIQCRLDRLHRLAYGAPGHWRVESMHWLLDVEFRTISRATAAVTAPRTGPLYAASRSVLSVPTSPSAASKHAESQQVGTRLTCSNCCTNER